MACVVYGLTSLSCRVELSAERKAQQQQLDAARGLQAELQKRTARQEELIQELRAKVVDQITARSTAETDVHAGRDKVAQCTHAPKLWVKS
jgi:hypothetical protein